MESIRRITITDQTNPISLPAGIDKCRKMRIHSVRATVQSFCNLVRCPELSNLLGKSYINDLAIIDGSGYYQCSGTEYDFYPLERTLGRTLTLKIMDYNENIYKGSFVALVDFVL